MKIKYLLFLLTASALHAGTVSIDEKALGQKLGGWRKREFRAAEYPISGAVYRTYKPEISPTPDGGIFVSVRIDNVRGWLSSDDHAVLEISINSKGAITGAQSTIAIQGRSISSDLIRGGTAAGQNVFSVEHAVKIGTDLVADMSAKLLQENVVEAGRVSFPAVLRHNYNQLYQSIRTDSPPQDEKELEAEKRKKTEKSEAEEKAKDEKKAAPHEAVTNKNPTEKPGENSPAPPPAQLQIKPYGQPQANLPVPKS